VGGVCCTYGKRRGACVVVELNMREGGQLDDLV